MTAIELKLERGEPIELSEAIAAIRTLDAVAAEIARVDMRLHAAYAAWRLEAIEERKRAIRRAVKMVLVC